MTRRARRAAAERLMRQSARVSLSAAAEQEVSERLEQIYPTRPSGLLPRSLRRSIGRAQGHLPLKKRAARVRHPALVYPVWRKGVPVKGVPVIDAWLRRSPELKAALAERDKKAETQPTKSLVSRIIVPRFGALIEALQQRKKA